MQTIVNLGTGGADLNGQNGSTTSADSNDALFLDWPGDNGGNYVYLPGVAGNYLSVPDEAALDITGDIDIRAKVALDDWTAGYSSSALSKWNTATKSYILMVNGVGGLSFYWTTDGVNDRAKASTALLPVADGEPLWIRATLDVDNGSGGHDINFYTSTDGVVWTQLGATVTTAGTTSIYSGIAQVDVGAWGTGPGATLHPAKYYRAQILNGIDGTPVLDIDCSQISSGADTSFTALTGQTVTINRSTSGRKSVAVVSPVWLFGTDDYMQVADNALLDFDADESFTVLAVVRQWATPASFGRWLDKANGNTQLGFRLLTSGTALTGRSTVGDGTNTVAVNGSSFTSGESLVASVVADRSAQTLQVYANSSASATSSIASVGSLANAHPLRIGARGDGSSSYQDFELLSVAVFRRVLTSAEIAALTTYYENRWA